MTTSFFFYNNLKNIELINKISNKYTEKDGYILVENYDKDFNLTINSNPQYNNKILDGKIVFFNYNLEYILDKINYIDGVNNFSNSKNKFTVDGIYVNTYTCGVYKAYIIY